MRLLVIGGGGREHALVAKLAGESGVSGVLCAPGNPGIARHARCVPIAAGDVDGLLALAQAERIDLTVVGPELPLAHGIVDRFRAAGRRIFGPSRAAAALECSKAFAKSFMASRGIPTARYRTCDAAASACAVARSGELGFPLVVKADGLAAGKGVAVARDLAEAERAIRAAMEDRQFGDAGTRVVLEECLEGPEVSFFALTDGRRVVPMISAQDHKRAFDGDEGPNTGGMGAFAPSPLVDAVTRRQVMREIVEPAIAGLREDGREYCGFLYAGLMMTCAGPKVIEFNVRFGDPEAQVVLPLIDDDLAPRLAEAAEGALSPAPLRFSDETCVGVVLASSGYPGAGPAGLPIAGLERAADTAGVLVYHAGTAAGPGGATLTAGGRVLTVVGRGPTYETAIARAYDGVALISFDGMHYRRDIGRKALPNSQLPTPNCQSRHIDTPG
jgi:phosphoribosylamine---glycine ligase